jgi:hypothetical protein
MIGESILSDKEFGYMTDSCTIFNIDASLPKLNNTKNLPYTLSSSDTSIAEITNNTIVIRGTSGDTTITASFTGNGRYNAKSCSYLLIVAIA